ncbi:MAG: M20/M25/M40 family metallo-hydrolase [Rhodothermales bacterium]
MNDLTACVAFLQRLIQTPSLPGEEETIAGLVCAEMERLGYDDVALDKAGNAIGKLAGRGAAPAMMLNTHLDHVDVGDPARWPHPPFGGEIHDDRVWGRGAVDIKGPLATQVYGAARLKRKGIVPAGDVYVTAVVYEEIGGLGADYLTRTLTPPYIVIGEPSRNELRRGHRGRLELELHVTGKSVHASVPERGVNPLEVVAAFITGLAGVARGSDPDLGESSFAPTLIRTDQISSNVVPSEAWLTIDWRNVPGESDDAVIARLQALADRCLIPGATATVSMPSTLRTSYTGYAVDQTASNGPFITRADDPALVAAQQVLGAALGSVPATGLWRFATDGGHFIRTSATLIGFGPGDEGLAHTVDEHIPIAQLATALDAYEALAERWTASIAGGS